MQYTKKEKKRKHVITKVFLDILYVATWDLLQVDTHKDHPEKAGNSKKRELFWSCCHHFPPIPSF
jgi:hypothetical protein